ncbi:MAG: aromatic-ring-hydroxylating dioxygenase subunit beta [Woeseiaceae bacterium]
MTPVDELVYESCLALNAEDWAAFLGWCEPEGFRYRIVNFSPEIRREQCWMDRDWKGLKSLLELLPKHNSDHSPLTRHATVYRVRVDAAADEAAATTMVAIYRTQLDGVNSHFESGQTSLFAVGRYEDRIRIRGGEPRLLARTVRLDTRQVDIGSHFPL